MKRIGPLYVGWSEIPDRGVIQGRGGSDVWYCDEHPKWQGEITETLKEWTKHTSRWETFTPFKSLLWWKRESVLEHLRIHGLWDCDQEAIDFYK